MKKAFLFLLGLIAFIGVQAQTSPYTGSEIKAGNFYIYNVQSGYWLQNNNRVGDWNSQVQLGPDGFEWELIAREDGTWQLNPKFGNNHSLNISNGYIDTGDAVSGWTLTPVEGVTNGFTITGGDQMLGTNADKLLDKHASGDNAVFQLVTFSERWSVAEGQFAEVSGDKPMDLTWLIPGADMNIADEHANELVQTAPSQASAKFVTGQTNTPHGNGIREIWNNPGGSYDIGYKLTNLPGGVYRFMVSGYYRDGAREGVGAKYKNGTEVIRPEIYINEKTQPIMSICEPQKTAAGSGCNYSSDGIYIPDNTGEASTATASGFYENKAIKLVLADGADEISLGVRASDGVDADWLILDKFQLVYYGPENLESSLAMLNAAIEAAEAWDASVTSDAMAQTLAEAIDAAKGKLSAIDSDEIEAAAEELNAALKQAQSVDVSVLKATAALANKEGLDTAEADDVVANATDAGAVSSALFNLQAARKINAQKLPDVYTGSAPADGEKVYIYNLGTGMFLGTGASYNTHCAVDQVGIEIELVADGDGFKMKTNRGGGWLNKGNRETSTYVDCPEHTWYFISVSDGIYNISFDGQANNLLGYNPLSVNDDGKTYWSSIGIKREDANDPMNQWKIVTAAERETLLAEASKENPVDVSYLIPAASLNKQDTFPWVAEGDAHHAKVDNFENWGFEFWNNSSFKFSQTIENLPAGLYEIKVQSFWREGDGANQVAIVNSGGALNQKAYLFANGAQELLPNIASVLDFVPGVGGDATTNKGIFPNWVNEAIEYMETGAYWATVKAVVEEDGTLTLGIAADDNSGPYDWSVIDNFRLTYLGEASDYDRALTSIKDGQSYRIFTEVDGEKYYLTPDGYLADSEQKAGTFTFNKVAGEQYPEGFQLLDSYFTNPPVGGNPTLANGHIATDTNSKRNTWEAQVFFQNADGKFAIRATNAAGGDSSWPVNAKTFWTVNEGPVAEYSFDQNYVWQIEENVDPRPALLAEIKPITDTWAAKMQKIDGLVTDASQYTSNAWVNESTGLPGLLDYDYGTYFHTTWGSGVNENHYLQAELPDATDKFYFYFVKRDPVNNNNVNNRPTDIIISGSNDGETFTEITEISEGMPTSVPPIDYMSGLISSDEAYKYIRFTIIDTNNHAQDSNGHKFFTFSEFYVLPSTELFDDAAGLVFSKYTDMPLEGLDDIVDRVKDVDARLSSYFKDVDLNLVLNGEVKATETVELMVGKEAPEVPSSFRTNADVVAEYSGLVFFTPDVDEITEETTAINYTAEDAISESFDNAKWFNMTIRGTWWVAMDETEPYYPKQAADADLTSEASQWAFGLSEGGDKLVIWNRAAGADKVLTNTGETNDKGQIIVVMREGSDATWDFAPNSDGFVIHQVGTGDNQWVNQNGGGGGPLSIWDSANAKGDGGSILRIYPVEVEEETLEIALDVERVVGQGYTADVATVDFAEAKEFLGVEEVTSDMLYFVNPDGTEMDYATYSVSPQADFTYDGWCDADGAAAQWGATTAICVKFFQAIPYGAYEICDMNEADEVGKTYTVKWALKANDKAVVYSINVTFIAAPVTDLTFDDLEIAQTEELDVKSELGAAYEGLTATVDIDNILATLEVESLGDVTIAAVQPDGTLDLNYKLGTTDGWRDADGTWKSWVDDLEAAPYFYVKADFASEPQLYQIGGYPGHTDEAAKFTAPYVFVVNGTAKAYLLNVNLIYGEGPESFTYEGTLDQTVTIPGVPDPVATSTGVEETLTITENEDGTVNITYAGFTMAAPAVPLSDFTLENVVVNENEDGSKSYSFEGEVVVTATTGMILTYSATLTGTQAEGEGPTLTLVLAQKSGMANEIVFNPNSTEPTPEPAEYAGMIKQILSHPDTGVQGQATDEQTVKIEAGEDGKVNITYSGFTMPVTGAEIPEFTVEGVTVTENEDGSISYLLEENEDGEMPTVVIVRGTGTVTYKVALEGTQESADATPVLKLVLDNSVVDTVWFGENEKTIDKAIVTGINGVNALGTDGTIFDLSGRKVEKIQRGGIYIVNGKKVSVK